MTPMGDPRLVAGGKKGGRSRSAAKLAAARRNALHGGRPAGPEGVFVTTSVDHGKPYSFAFDRDDRDKLVAALLRITTPRVQLYVLSRHRDSQVGLYARPLGTKRGA